MSDNQRRALCRLIFLLVCAVPTLFCTYWICHPQTADGWAQSIQAETGIEASIDFVETPSPYKTVLRNLRLTDPEHGVLLDTVQVTIRFDKNVEVEIPYEVRHVNNSGLARLLKTVHQTTVRRGVDKPWRIRFAKPLKIARADAALYSDFQPVDPRRLQAMLQSQQNTFVMEDLNLELIPSVEGTTVSAYFASAESDNLQTLQNPISQNRVEVQLKRERHVEEIWLHTPNQTLPCWLAADFAGDITKDLGRDASFSGDLQVQTHLASGQNRVYVNGILGSLSMPSYPLNLPINEQTQMQIALDDCKFVNGQAEHWSALLDVPELRLSKQLDLQTLFQDSRHFVVGNAIRTAILEGLSTRVASEHGPNWN